MIKILKLLIMFIVILNNNIQAAAAVATEFVDLATLDAGYQKYLQEHKILKLSLTNEIYRNLYMKYDVRTGQGIARIMVEYVIPFFTYDQWQDGKKLIDAIMNERYEEAKKLVYNGAYPNARNSHDGYTSLMWAINRNHKELAELLLANGADPNARTSSRDNTPLILASSSPRDYTDIVKLLLDNGANVNASNKLGETPLMRATKSGNKEIAKLLLANGAIYD